jgi:hypothetical protein
VRRRGRAAADFFVHALCPVCSGGQTASVPLGSTSDLIRDRADRGARVPPVRLDGAVALLHAEGVVLVVLAPGEVVVAAFARNLDRISRILTQRRARLLIAHGSEFIDVPPTAALLRRERHTTWAIGELCVGIDLEPLPGLDYGRLLLDAEPAPADETGPPWADGAHRARIAAARMTRRSSRRR